MSDKFYLDDNEKEMEETAFKRLEDLSKNSTQTDGIHANFIMLKELLNLGLISESTMIDQIFGEYDKDDMIKFLKEIETLSEKEKTVD
jgi:hypothetical protein